MRIKLINPNTTASMTEMMRSAAAMVAAPGTQITAVTSRSGAASIEGHYDEALSVVGLIDEIRDGEPADAYVIACFGDPGLLAAREITAAPVLGIAEAAMHAASFIATGFSVVTTLARTRIIAEHLVRNYGMEHHCRRVRATELPVLELERPGSNAREVILAECRAALEEDQSGAIVLGCAGMADLAAYLEESLQVPVIDGVVAAVKFAEALVGMGLRTSKHGDLAYPLPKPYAGKLASYSPASHAPQPEFLDSGRARNEVQLRRGRVPSPLTGKPRAVIVDGGADVTVPSRKTSDSHRSSPKSSSSG